MRQIVLAVFLGGCAGLQWVPLPKTAEPHRVRTADGFTLALVRYAPVGATRGRPVLMLHGISANARNMDLDDEHSMARWFAGRGREVWTVSLRGTGESDESNGNDRPHGYSFDAFWQLDLPAAIDYVKKASSTDAVDCVGHSMGGLVIYAYLAQRGQGIHAAATLGSPTKLDWGTNSEALIQLGAKLLPSGWGLWTSWGAHKVVPLQGLFANDPLERLLYVKGNTTLQSFKRLIAYGSADIAPGVAAQFVTQVATGNFVSADAKLDFRRALQAVTTPVIVVAARLDRLALVPGVYDGYRALGGDKQWLLISRAHGAVAEYGHMDLLIGDRAHTDVWTPVLQFFNRHER